MDLAVMVYSNRDLLGELCVVDRGKTLQRFDICAKSDPGAPLADPPVGTYSLIGVSNISDEHDTVVSAYGESIIYFEMLAGIADKSKCRDGKFIVAIHGGLEDMDRNLRPTEGGLRLRNKDLDSLINLIGDQTGIILAITEESAGLLGRFTKPKGSRESAVKIRQPHWNNRARQIYSDDNLPYWLMLYYLMFQDDGSVMDNGGGDDVDSDCDDSGDDTPPQDIEEGPPVDVNLYGGRTDAESLYAPLSPPPLIVDPFVGTTHESTHSTLEPVAASSSGWTHVEAGGPSY